MRTGNCKSFMKNENGESVDENGDPPPRFACYGGQAENG